MKVGLHCIGYGGPSSRREWVCEAARLAEDFGFSTIWQGEHFAIKRFGDAGVTELAVVDIESMLRGDDDPRLMIDRLSKRWIERQSA